MNRIIRLLLAGLLLGSTSVSAGDTLIIPEQVADNPNDKVVELRITFPPRPAAEVRKQRKSLGRTKTGQSVCSGSLISPYGHVLTAKHCVQDATNIKVVLSDGQEYIATTSALSASQDLAVIQIGKFGTPFFKLAAPLVQGQTVHIMGSPLGLTGTLTTGTVARLHGDHTLLDCTALPGNSGGPVVDADGNLAGVLSAIIIVYAGPSHISIAQSLDSIKMFFYQLTGKK